MRLASYRALAALSLAVASSAAAQAESVAEEPSRPPERCCLPPGGNGRCESSPPTIREEMYGPYELGDVRVEARVQCRTGIADLGVGMRQGVREMISLELVDPSARVLYRREFRRELLGANESSAPSALPPDVVIAVVHGERSSGILLQETRTFDSGLTPVSTLRLLVHRRGVIAPLGAALRIVGGLTEEAAHASSHGHALGRDVDVDIQGDRVDAVCTVRIDWQRGLELPRDAVCQAWAHEPSHAPQHGRIVLSAAPRSGAPARTTRIEAGMPVRILQARGRLAPQLGRAPAYLNFRERWIEVEIGPHRGWLHRSEDIQLLGIFVERC
jgi:hypothetical protein